MSTSLPTRAKGAAVIASELEKPDLDNRSYRVIRLSNKLEALIAHDPDTDKASAALDVHVGNFSDRDDLQVSTLSRRTLLGPEKAGRAHPCSIRLRARAGGAS